MCVCVFRVCVCVCVCVSLIVLACKGWRENLERMPRRNALWLVGRRRVVALLRSHVAIVIDASLVASWSRCVDVFPNSFHLLPYATFTSLRAQFVAIVYLGICVCVVLPHLIRSFLYLGISVSLSVSLSLLCLPVSLSLYLDPKPSGRWPSF